MSEILDFVGVTKSLPKGEPELRFFTFPQCVKLCLGKQEVVEILLLLEHIINCATGATFLNKLRNRTKAISTKYPITNSSSLREAFRKRKLLVYIAAVS